jgi:SAM-dependent methyltransferase
VVLADAMEMSIATDSVAHAVSVWVVHSVADPVRLFAEAARVLRPGGRYVMCTGQRPAPDDRVGTILKEMTARMDVLRGASRPRGVTVDQVLVWARQAGFDCTAHELDRQWHAAPSEELAAFAQRSWPVMRELDDAAIDEATGPAIEALRALPDEDCIRRATADMLVLSQP